MGESKEYMTLPEENGSINISEEVIAAIAVGASGMWRRVRHGDCHGRQRHGPGPQQEERPEGRQGCEDRHDRRRLVLDIYLTVEYGHPIPTVAENAQKAVIGAVEAMTGCSVEAVNIHVGGVTLA